MKRIYLGIVFTLIISGFPAAASAHGGGLDSQGGHNCRVGSCAGTYHCHQPRGPVCQEAFGIKPSATKTSKPRLKETDSTSSKKKTTKKKTTKKTKKKGLNLT